MTTADKSFSGPLAVAFKACRRHFFAAALFSALLNILYLAPTLYMLQVYDRVVPTHGFGTLLFLTAIFAFAVATLSLLDLVRTRLLVRASARLDRLLSPQVIAALLSQFSAGGLRSSAALREFDVLRSTLTGAGVLALFDAPWTPIYIIICFCIHWALGLLALVGSGILLGLAFLNERSTKAPLQKANEASSKLYASIDGSAAAGGVLRAMGMRRAMVQRHLDERRSSIHLSSQASFAGASYITLTKFFRLLLQSLALGLGAFLAIQQKISPGAIFAASLLVTRALAPIEQMVGAWKGVVQSRAAYKTMQQLFEKSDHARVQTLLPEVRGAVALERVAVLSPSRDRVLLGDINFRLDAGDALGVVGPSGAGKSTLVKVIAGALKASQGAIRFDGGDAKDWDEEQLARHIGYVPQEPTLFRGTVRDNIARFQNALGGDKVTIDAEVVRAAQACGAHETILRLPNGYDTELSWGGAGLSAGQAQRIALARAFYGRPSVVILDEPNAHLDADGETDLKKALDQLKADGVTVIVVAHRTGILAGIDKLMILRDGRIEMFGPRDEVTQRLAQAQAQAQGRPAALNAKTAAAN
jgi:ATP-binding cassette subfamily C protein